MANMANNEKTKEFDAKKFEEELLKLQTYKMFKGGEKLVYLDEVLALLHK